MENNKKTLILSILGVIVLIIAVVGVSFAMYTFSAAGTKENVITTGSVSISYDDTAAVGGNGQLTLTNQYPMTDALGIAQSGDKVVTFQVAAEVQGSMTLNYEFGITDISFTAEGGETPTLSAEHIKVVLYDETDSTYVIGSATEGVKMSTLQTNGSTDSDAMITSYRLAKGTFVNSAQHKYTMKVWVSSDYNLHKKDTTTGGTQTSATVKEQLTFKIKLMAKQAI